MTALICDNSASPLRETGVGPANVGQAVSALGDRPAQEPQVDLYRENAATTCDPGNVHWHRTLGALIDGLDKPNFWTVLVRMLGDVIRFDSWVVLCFQRGARPEVHTESPGLERGEDRLFRDYLEGYYLLDPFYLWCMDQPWAGLVRLDEVAPDNFENEEYYQRYFKLNVVKDEIQFTVPLAPGKVLTLSLGARRRFSVGELALLATITPWVLALMRQRTALDDVMSARAIGEPLEAGAGLELPGKSGLTGRELEVVHLLLSGSSSKAIAQKLRISPETVKAHRRHIYKKLGVKSHAELFGILLKSHGLSARRDGTEDA